MRFRSNGGGQLAKVIIIWSNYPRAGAGVGAIRKTIRSTIITSTKYLHWQWTLQHPLKLAENYLPGYIQRTRKPRLFFFQRQRDFFATWLFNFSVNFVLFFSILSSVSFLLLFLRPVFISGYKKQVRFLFIKLLFFYIFLALLGRSVIVTTSSFHQIQILHHPVVFSVS